jgi:hypothetical protein
MIRAEFVAAMAMVGLLVLLVVAIVVTTPPSLLPQDCAHHVTRIPARGGWPAHVVTVITCTTVEAQP